jgi:hypothetical protein
MYVFILLSINVIGLIRRIRSLREEYDPPVIRQAGIFTLWLETAKGYGKVWCKYWYKYVW